jgi:hypothetical protein
MDRMKQKAARRAMLRVRERRSETTHLAVMDTVERPTMHADTPAGKPPQDAARKRDENDARALRTGQFPDFYERRCT